MKTQSEKWFQDYCAHSGIACKRISEENNKTPDYELTIAGQRIIVEVKETSRNREERESDRFLSQRGYGSVLANTPGNRVRKKITDSSAQIKARTHGIYPSILVLCDLKFSRGQIAGHLDPYNIRVAMYGIEQMHVVVPREPAVGPYVTGMSYGPKRKMTEDCNTSISAIGVLFTPGPDEIALHVYHNRFAAVPLDPRLLTKYGISQFKLEDEIPSSTTKWEEVAVQDTP